MFIAMETISIIVPAWKEVSVDKSIFRLAEESNVELIFAMAQGDSATKVPPNLKTSRSDKGRAEQMNAGAKLAVGSIFLFLHADTSITIESLAMVRETLRNQDVAGGAYRLRIDSDSLWLRFVTFMANARSRIMKLPYGDQAIFIKREIFEKVGGYEPVPILEDVRLVEAMKREGGFKIIDDVAITSSRRWKHRGSYSATIRNWLIMICYFAGVGPHRLARMFRR